VGQLVDISSGLKGWMTGSTSQQSSIVFSLCLVILEFLCTLLNSVWRYYNTIDFLLRTSLSGLLHSTLSCGIRLQPPTLRYALSAPHLSIWWYSATTDYLLRSTSSGDIGLQATIYSTPLCLKATLWLKKLQLTLCYALSSAFCSTLSGETTTDCLHRPTSHSDRQRNRQSGGQSSVTFDNERPEDRQSSR
jgi:hypothetical protein